VRHKFSELEQNPCDIFHVKRTKKHFLPPKNVGAPPLFAKRTKQTLTSPLGFLGKTQAAPQIARS
jgi:hypothetical protein